MQTPMRRSKTPRYLRLLFIIVLLKIILSYKVTNLLTKNNSTAP